MLTSHDKEVLRERDRTIANMNEVWNNNYKIELEEAQESEMDDVLQMIQDLHDDLSMETDDRDMFKKVLLKGLKKLKKDSGF